MPGILAWSLINLPLLRINVLDSTLQGVVLDNRYYAGSCLPQYIQDVRFRKPYNLQQYTVEVIRKAFEDQKHLMLNTSHDCHVCDELSA